MLDEVSGLGSTAPLRSALFVDFDNIYLGLRKLDEKAAEAFASRPTQWLRWLEEGLDSDGATPRRFLVRNVYLNPVTFGSFRAVYTRTGFRAIDCPPLTGQGKNSADIYMVLDIVDSLQNGFRYDEFVIASADADFTPVLHRLRSQDRRTTVLTAGISAAAYRAVCDSYVAPEVLADVALGEFDEAREATSGEPPSPLVLSRTDGSRASTTSTASPPSQSDVDAVRRAIRSAVTAAPRPLVSAAAAHAALQAFPNLKESDWWGAGSFRAFLARYIPDLTYEGVPSPGYVYDPERHSIDDLPAAERVELSPLLQQVCVVTGAPALASERYATLFTALADQLEDGPYLRNETEKRVRDRTDLANASVGRNAVNFVTQGLIYSGMSLVAGSSAEVLARAWVTNLKSLCSSARMTLNPEDEAEIEAWVLGHVPRDN
jgi:hypothetical protein